MVPAIYASDFSEEILGAAYFIMKKMEGQPLWAVGFSEEEYAEISKQKIGMLAQIHGISSKEFGYRQLGLKATWYEALREMAEKLEEIRVYNETAAHPIVYNRETEIRYQIAVAYLALIEEVEKYVRYEPQEENYIRNTVDAGKMYDMAFGVLY